MERDAGKGDRAGAVENAFVASLLIGTEFPLENGGGINEPPRLQQLPAAPHLEDVARPALAVALGRGDPGDGQPERVLDAVEDEHDLAAPLLRETLTCVVVRGRAGSASRLGQLERTLE